MGCFIPPVRFFAVPPLGVALVSVDVVAIRLDRIPLDLKLGRHRLNELGVGAGREITVVCFAKVADLPEGVVYAVLFAVATTILIGHLNSMLKQPENICGTVVEPTHAGVVSIPFGAIVSPVGLLDVGAMSIESPRSQQLNALRRHLYNEFVGQVASGEARIVVYSENVHGGLEQVN